MVIGTEVEEFTKRIFLQFNWFLIEKSGKLREAKKLFLGETFAFPAAYFGWFLVELAIFGAITCDIFLLFSLFISPCFLTCTTINSMQL